LRKYCDGEVISDYKCEACNQTVDLEKKAAIDKLPNTLIIHLTRICFDFDTLRNIKLNNRVEFPEVLNLKEFMTDEIKKKDRKAAAAEKTKSRLR
jgi:ubiquitin carboxyl-terminal hydrolase 34